MASGIVGVTGGSGMVGRKIVHKLLLQGYEVRVLTRNKQFRDWNARVYYGDLKDNIVVGEFLKNVSYLFHCAAEVQSESKMWDINVIGTERLLHFVPSSSVTYLCHLSSAGVIGLTDNQLVDEDNTCNPQNTYERSKWAAEELVAKELGNRCIVILRPTNVIDEKRPGALALPMRSTWRDRCIVFLKGGECAHIVHAEDVADAAIHFMGSHFERPERFFVSCDHERFNTFGWLWSMYKAVQEGRSIEGIAPMMHLPVIIPHILRRLWRGSRNHGAVRYSSEKLLSAGFRFGLGVEGSVRRIAGSQRGPIE